MGNDLYALFVYKITGLLKKKYFFSPSSHNRKCNCEIYLFIHSCDVCPPACEDQVACAGYSNKECWDFSGSGGGGSGGSIYIRGQFVNAGIKFAF